MDFVVNSVGREDPTLRDLNMGYEHNHSADSSLARLVWAGVLNIAIAIVEFVGGLLSASLSIMSDALHNFTDAGAVAVSIVALKLNEKPKDLKHTFGLKRAQILAAILNSVVLILVSLFLMKEALFHFIDSTHVDSALMMIVGGLGLLANLLGAFLLHRDAGDNINIRSSYLHLLADSMSSATVIVGGLFIYLSNAYWIDSLLTFAISVYVLREGWEITRESVEIIMMVTPASVNIKKIQATIEDLPAVRNVHHVLQNAVVYSFGKAIPDDNVFQKLLMIIWSSCRVDDAYQIGTFPVKVIDGLPDFLEFTVERLSVSVVSFI